MDAITLLTDEHDKMRKLLTELEATTERGVKTRQELFATIKGELTLHEVIEEEIFYPELKAHPKAEDIVLEGYQEHHVVDLLMGELEQLDVERRDVGRQGQGHEGERRAPHGGRGGRHVQAGPPRLRPCRARGPRPADGGATGVGRPRAGHPGARRVDRPMATGGAAAAPAKQQARDPGLLTRLWRDYSLSIVVGALFVDSFLLHMIFGWWQYVADETSQGQQPTLFGDSGYRHLLRRVDLPELAIRVPGGIVLIVATAYLVHKGSHESKDGEDEMKAALAADRDDGSSTWRRAAQ